MATGYKALLALGDSHTKSVESTVQAALAQKKLKEQQRRKQQEEQERKQRELDTKLRLRYFEQQKKKEEAEAIRAAERRAAEAELQRREAENRDALRYGPKKAKTAAAANGKWPTSSSGVRDEVRRKRLPDDDDEIDTGSVLTREEKRERKLQAELKRTFNAPRRATGTSSGHRRSGKRLPGGAYDVTTTSADAVAAASGSGSVKERLSAMPNTLTRLNVVKRDTRTIDEIVRDRRENKEVLAGDRARGFDDWFTPSSRIQPKKDKVASSASSTSSRPSSQPISSASAALPKRAVMPSPTPPKARPTPKAPASQVPPSSKKRQRSDSMSRSVSPPPLKRAHVGGAKSAISKSASRSRSPPRGGRSTLSDEIWGLFGKNKAAYVARDVFSDSEDDDAMMEAGASALEREEKMSERIARREEREAEAAERRHEEEKRRRKAAAAAAAR